ncbi:MAG: N-acetylmuramic acid 6-phosphate etherase [candidate division WS2 bacterium]|nr:N-acetylmuramic acid 6-phosphate etherase [Candidatus Psychracetigena formicireducens]
MTNILDILKITPSSQSTDFVENKKQFQLHTLLTEQPHKNTWNLSFVMNENALDGLKMIFSVDEDISTKFKELVKDTNIIDNAANSIVEAIENRKKIYIYGCGATGRLAKQMESAIWRPFWKKVKQHSLWNKLKNQLPKNIEDRLIGEMTGGDRALISALEGLEDLQLVGSLQLLDRGVEKGDAVFCVTEGGETSSVIGTILTAVEQYGELTTEKIYDAKKLLYFIYNNPDDVLYPFDRSRTVIEHPAISKINLSTGPQAITGSTRMQSTTSETFILGVILEEGIYRLLKKLLTLEELSELGFSQAEPSLDKFASEMGLLQRILSFDRIMSYIANSLEEIARFTVLESETYKNKKHATYFARKALITVFIDCAERSPTFRLFPLDTVMEKEPKCWVQVWTAGSDYKEAWQNFLSRPFRGLEERFYKADFETKIDDFYLKQSVLRSLSQAGQEQEKMFDFSFSKTQTETREPKEGDLAVLICMDEEIDDLLDTSSYEHKFISLTKEKNANLCLILVSNKKPNEVQKIINKLKADNNFFTSNDVVINITMNKTEDDPLNLRRQTLLKMLLNGHSTGVLVRIGRVVGNTMTHVNPSNLKLIGRATYLILSHINDVVSQKEWVQKYGKTEPITYSEANAILFEAMSFVQECLEKNKPISEVSISIVRIMEALKTKSYIRWENALHILETEGLENYLSQYNPSLGYHS